MIDFSIAMMVIWYAISLFSRKHIVHFEMRLLPAICQVTFKLNLECSYLDLLHTLSSFTLEFGIMLAFFICLSMLLVAYHALILFIGDAMSFSPSLRFLLNIAGSSPYFASFKTLNINHSINRLRRHPSIHPFLVLLINIFTLLFRMETLNEIIFFSKVPK